MGDGAAEFWRLAGAGLRNEQNRAEARRPQALTPLHPPLPTRLFIDQVLASLPALPDLGRRLRGSNTGPNRSGEFRNEPNHLRTELVLDALEMAIGQRRPDGVIHHSDQGSQYTSLAFGKRCKEAGVRPSMGSVGDAYDNAMCESFFATLECELLERRRFASQAEAKIACFSFIEGWYNPARLHSALGYRSPIAYEHAIEVQSTEA